MKLISLLKKFSALTLSFLIAVPPAFAVEAARPVPAAVVAAGAMAFGPQVGANVAGIIQKIPINSTEGILTSIQDLRKAFGVETDLAQKAAIAVVWGAFADPKTLEARLAQTDLPKDAVERMLKLAPHVATGMQKDLALAQAVEGGRQDIVKAYEAAVDSGKAESAVGAAIAGFLKNAGIVNEPVAEPGAVVVSDGDKDSVKWAGKEYPTLTHPTDGVSNVTLWVQAHQDSDAMDQAAYNYDLIELAKSVVAAAKAGKKQRIVGDYSNWFPHIESPEKHGGKAAERTEAMKLIIANLGPNLELYIVKGLGSIGINHLKLTQFHRKGEDPLGQGGSANYTKSSMTTKQSDGLSHWENYGYTLDKKRNALDQKMIEWVMRRGKPFREDLTVKEAEPTFDPNDPIPADTEPSLNFHGKMFPVAVYSPDAKVEETLVGIVELIQKSLAILMFSPFLPPRLTAAVIELMKKGIPVRMLADSGQGHNAAAKLRPLVEAGLQLRFISGPNAALHPDQPFDKDHEKMHEKVMIADAELADAIMKAIDSLNLSVNAEVHNFEATKLWQGRRVQKELAHFEEMWKIARVVALADIDRWIARAKEAMANRGSAPAAVNPWEGQKAADAAAAAQTTAQNP